MGNCQMVKLIIMDADDTLYPWIKPYIENMLEILHELADLAQVPFQEAVSMAGEINRQIGEIEEAAQTLDELVCRLSLSRSLSAAAGYRFSRRFHHEIAKESAAYDFLRMARLLNIPVCVLSESRPARLQKKLEACQIRSLVSKIICRSDRNEKINGMICRHHVKPDPALLFEICNEFGVKPEEVLYAGDSETKDMLAALECGMQPALCRVFDQSTARQGLYALSHWTQEEFAFNLQLLDKWQKADKESVFTFTDYRDLQRFVFGNAGIQSSLTGKNAFSGEMRLA